MKDLAYKSVQYAIIALVWSAIIVSCKQGKVEKISDKDILNLPTQEIRDFGLIHSEKGVMRYEVEAKEVKYYQFVDTPYFAFPKGLYARSFTADSIPESDIRADSGVYRERPQFFSAQGNVIVQNFIKNMRLETEGPLYWDEQKKEIYTDAAAIIIRHPDTIPALYGLVADDRFTTYTLRTIRKGVIYRDFNAKDSTGSTPRDSLTTVNHE